jgi:hypothetical protein
LAAFAPQAATPLRRPSGDKRDGPGDLMHRRDSYAVVFRDAAIISKAASRSSTSGRFSKYRRSRKGPVVGHKIDNPLVLYLNRRQGDAWGNPMVELLLVWIVGFAAGYGVRDAISRHRRRKYSRNYRG